jgi:hypothetical protein
MQALRPDGFVSVDAGTLTTKPIAFDDSKLQVNSVGNVKVEVLTSAGDVLGTSALTGDSLAHAVRFGGKTIGEINRDGAVRLRFTVEPGAQLYSFSIR